MAYEAVSSSIPRAALLLIKLSYNLKKAGPFKVLSLVPVNPIVKSFLSAIVICFQNNSLKTKKYWKTLNTFFLPNNECKSFEKVGSQNTKWALTHSSVKTCHTAFSPIFHTPDRSSSHCCWIMIPITLLLMLLQPSGISSPTSSAIWSLLKI